ncbi:MAG: ABC transporter substrate-binding protein [Marinilabilia sp.]
MKLLFNKSLFLVLEVSFLLVSGCSQIPDQSKGPVREITDMLGRRVEIPEKIDSVIGVGPGALRLLVYMDLADRVSGIEDVELRPGRPYMFAHPELKEKPLIGPQMGGDSELIAMNDPDVVFMAFSSASDADELQKGSGVPVVALNTGNLRNARDTLFRAFRLIGDITGRRERAGSLEAFINEEIGQLDSITSGVRQQPRAYIGAVSYRGSHGISSTEAFYSPFQFVNAKNVAHGLKNEEPVNPTGTYVDVEQIIKWDPDYLFIDAAGLDQTNPDLGSGSPLALTLSAFRAENIYTMMPHNWYATNFENVLANAWFAGKVMYPGLFSGHDVEQKARELYRFMLGNDVYDQMQATYDGWNQL